MILRGRLHRQVCLELIVGLHRFIESITLVEYELVLPGGWLIGNFLDR